jgi:hypothetical protein
VKEKKTSMKQMRLFFILLAALAIAIVACGGDETPTPTTAPTGQKI